MRLSGAFLLNCELFALTLLFALPLGLVVSFGSMSRCKPLAGLVKTFVWIIRGTPLMLQIIVIYLGPGLLGMNNPWPSGSGGRMVAAVVAFACVFSMVHIGIGKFGQWYTDSDLVEQDNNALLLKEDLPEGDYRVDTYKIHDNIGMWLDKSCLQYFGSTAAPSILSFYPALGVKRDVRSSPSSPTMLCAACSASDTC